MRPGFGTIALRLGALEAVLLVVVVATWFFFASGPNAWPDNVDLAVLAVVALASNGLFLVVDRVSRARASWLRSALAASALALAGSLAVFSGLHEISLLVLSRLTAPSIESRFAEAGGADAVKRDCRVYRERIRAALDAAQSSDAPERPPTPPFDDLPALAKLDPQLAFPELEGERGPMLRVQLTGGFSHSGLMVYLEPIPADFMPPVHAGWRVRKIADGVFAYRE